jgi:hypothetical protein
MLRGFDSAASPVDSPNSVNWRVAFPMSGRSARGNGDFGGQYLAYAYPCPSNTRDVTIASAGRGAEAVG